jgi:hypothetical protein
MQPFIKQHEIFAGVATHRVTIGGGARYALYIHQRLNDLPVPPQNPADERSGCMPYQRTTVTKDSLDGASHSDVGESAGRLFGQLSRIVRSTTAVFGGIPLTRITRGTGILVYVHGETGIVTEVLR